MNIKTVGCMKFHEDIAKQIVKENHKELIEFFNDPIIKKKIDAGEWRRLYYDHIIPGPVTCVLLLAGIDFMSGDKGLNSTPINFAGLQGTGVLASIDIPEGIQIIGQEAFNNQTNLEYISLPSTLKEIRWGAFRYTGLTMHDNIQRVKYNGTRQEFIDKVYVIEPISHSKVKIYCKDGVVEYS